MNNNLTELVFILDRSGSMAGLEDDTVGGCTALLDAIGGAVHHIANVHKYAREEDRPTTIEKSELRSHRDGVRISCFCRRYQGYVIHSPGVVLLGCGAAPGFFCFRTFVFCGRD